MSKTIYDCIDSVLETKPTCDLFLKTKENDFGINESETIGRRITHEKDGIRVIIEQGEISSEHLRLF